ncbi:hypothetical protein WJX82_005500 [Trebouxia sp. C0006]
MMVRALDSCRPSELRYSSTWIFPRLRLFTISSGGVKSLYEPSNFALIEEQNVSFKPGLNVITGESGAGKSVLVEALGQVFGMPASDNCVRPPATTASVEAHLHLSAAHQAALPKLLASLGLPATAPSSSSSLLPATTHSSSSSLPLANQLVLRREISTVDTSVRSRCYVNGTATSLRVLRELRAALVDVNGQHAALSIRDSVTQIAMLDRIAGITSQAAAFGGSLHTLRQMEQQLADIASLGNEEERSEIQQMIQEVHRSKLEEGEERFLRARLRQLESRRSSVERAGLVHLGVSGEGGVGGVVEALRTLEGHVDAILTQEEAHTQLSTTGQGNDLEEDAEVSTSGNDDEDGDSAASIADMDEALSALEQARILVKSAAGKVGAYARKHRYLQQEHDEAQQRLHHVERLLKQFDFSSSQELLTAVAEAEADLDMWYQMEGQEEELQEQVATQQQHLQEAAVQLSLRRQAAGGKLKAAVEKCLAELAMQDSQFDVDLTWPEAQQDAGLYMPEEVCRQAGKGGDATYAVTPTGLDQVQFLLGAGPGEPLRPLSDVASGGESARIMLALKAAPVAAVDISHQANGSAPDVFPDDVATMAPPLMILDELDSGVGARLGKSIGRLLRRMGGPQLSTQQLNSHQLSLQSELSQQHQLGAQQQSNLQPEPERAIQHQLASTSQILCVSHLPQVAAYADHHLCVRKTTDLDGRVHTHIAILESHHDRAQEVAAMLGLGHVEALSLLEAAQADM